MTAKQAMFVDLLKEAAEKCRAMAPDEKVVVMGLAPEMFAHLLHEIASLGCSEEWCRERRVHLEIYGVVMVPDDRVAALAASAGASTRVDDSLRSVQ
jgi:hypothetical protein